MPGIKAKIVRIGNSRGIRIPKTMLDQYNINDEVELEAGEDCLIIRSSDTAREGWETAFRKMHTEQDDNLVIDDSITNEFDEDEWEW